MATKNTFGLGPLERIEQEYLGLGQALQNTNRGIAADQRQPQPAQQQQQQMPKVDTRQPTRPNTGRGAGELLPPQQFVGLFEGASRKHNVPVNVLMALAQQESTYDPRAVGSQTQWGTAKGMMQYLDSTARMMGINPYDPGQAIDAAARQIRQRLDKGYSMEDAVKEHFAGPNRKLWGPKTKQYGIDVLGKAARIREQLYGNAGAQPQQADPQPMLEAGTPEYDARIAEQMAEIDAASADIEVPRTEQEDGGFASFVPEPLSDFAKQFIGGAYKGAGATVRGLGAIPKIMGDYTTTPLVNSILGTEYTTKNMLDVPADLVNKYGESIQEGVSEASQQAIKDSTPGGDLFDPSTWTFGESPSVRGYMALGADVFGQILPIVASSMATAGQSALAQAGSAMITGGAQGGGVAIEETRDLIDEMATTFVGEEGGLTLLEKESPYYRELLAQGKTPEQALDLTKDAAERMAYIMTFPVSGAGGIATSKILHPATKVLSRQNIAARVAGRAALGAAEEGTQEALEFMQTRRGINTAIGTDLNVTEDTFGDFILGAIAGGKTGAVGGLVSQREGVADQSVPTEQGGQPATYRDPETGQEFDVYSDGLGDEVRVPREQGAPAAAQAQPDQEAEQAPANKTDPQVEQQVQEAQELGPISRALQAGNQQAQEQLASRVVVATPLGEMRGFLEGFQEDGQGGFVARVLGDDGQTYQYTHNDGVSIVTEEQYAAQAQAVEQADLSTGETVDPETGEILAPSVEETAETEVEAQAEPILTDDVAVEPEAETAPEVAQDATEQQAQPATEPEPTQELERPAPRRDKPVTQMTEGELNQRLEFLHKLSKTNDGWSNRMTREKRRVEEALAQVERAPVVPLATDKTTKGGKPLVELFFPEMGVNVLVREDQWNSDAARLPSFDAEGNRGVGKLQTISRDALRSSTAQTETAAPAQSAADTGVIRQQAEQETAPQAAEQPNTYDQAKARVDAAQQRMDAASEALSQFDNQRLPNGLTPDSVRETPEWRAAKQESDAAFRELQNANQNVVRNFSREARADREADRARRAEAVAAAQDGQAPTQEQVERPAADSRRQKALDRIAAGRAWFGDETKARNFIEKNGLTESHTVEQTGSKRFEVVEGIAQTAEIQPEAVDTSQSEVLPNEQVEQPTPSEPEAPRQPVTVTREPGITTIVLDPGAATRQPARQAEPAPQESTADADTEATSDALPNELNSLFANNTIFTADRVEAARARLRKKLGQLNSGIDPEQLIDGMTIAGAYIEGGVRKFGDYASRMIADLGDGIKPYLLSFWEGARSYPGLDTEGMTSVEDSRKEFEALITPQDTQNEAVGEIVPKPKRRTRKTGAKRDMTLTQDWGVESIDGYSDDYNRETGNTLKDAFIKEARDYLTAVSTELADRGYFRHADNKGRPMRPVNVNEGGVAGSGNISMTMAGPEGVGVYVHIGDTALRGIAPTTPSGIAIMFRAATNNDRLGVRGQNQWAPVDLSAADLAAMIDAHVNREAQRNDEQTEQGVQASDRARVPQAGARREYAAQQGTAQLDFGDVGTRQPENVGEPETRGDGATSGLRSSRENVEPAGRANEGGATSDGRTGTGRARASNARAGSAGRSQRRTDGSRGATERVTTVKAPETVSPANEGAGDFVIADPLKIVGGGQVARFNKNQAAIELRNRLQDEGRKPTAEEQEVLAGYTGWGSFGQELFQGSWANPKPKAGWEARDSWLREHLGQSEWEGLQRSIINAHYTDPPTVTAMWDMVKRMGFDGGRVLEPSIGIGNFFGMMPTELAGRSQRAGIELDPVTGSMAQMLYPEANIQIMGYEQSKTPDGFYDLVIGNWPFADYSPADRRYNRLNPMLHDYFFLKALDQTRPGGIVIGITSKGTMDKKDSRVRTELAKKGELVAAFRLPSGAFEEYAGTSVVTDIIVLRKRAEPAGVVAGEGWIRTRPYQTKEGTPVELNEYYHNNPTHVIGEIDFGHGTTSFRPGMIVNRPANMMEQLRRIVDLVPEGAYQKDTRGQSISYVANHTNDRTNSLIRNDDGLFIVQGEYLAPANEVVKYQVKSEATTRAREAELGALVEMRRLYGELIDAQREGNAETQRTALRKAFDAFKAEHGGYSDSFGLKYLRRIDDPFYPALAALEVNGEPAAILNESTVRGRPTIESPSISDAFVLARNQNVNPSPEQIAELAGRSVDEVKAELINNGAAFETPGGDFVPADIYLSGNVREKLRQAKAGLEAGNTAMERNIAALEEIIPEDIPYFKIETQLGATWVPGSTYSEFVAHMLGLDSTNDIKTSFQAGAWKIDFPSALNSRTEASNGFGSPHVPFKRLVNAAISNQTINVRRRDTDGTEYIDHEASKEVNAKIADMRLRFGEWLWSDPERRIDLEREYSETRNSYATPRFDGSFLGFEGMALTLGRGPFNLREHQVNAIWRALVTKKSLNAHEVGTGKTFTMGGIAVESRRYGLAKKPLLFAHNANSKSVAAEIQQMYPAAKVLYVDNLAKGNIKTRMMQIANDDWDVVVFPHSLIDRIGFKEETLLDMAQQQLDELEQAAREAAQEDGVELSDDMLTDEEGLKKLRSVTAKQLVKQRLRVLSTIEKLAQQASREDSIAFEDLGVDMVLVDEAHEFKKPPIATKMKIKGLQTQTSNRSISMSFITRYVRGMNNGGNIHLFTGTPITNTMTEVFHMMRYMMQEEMESVGLADWDGWFGSFAREVEDVELSSTGEYETVTRLQSFINVPELRRMIGQYMDVVFAEDMPEMQPRRVNGKTLNDPSLTEAERAELLNGRTEGAADRPYKMVVNESADMSADQLRVFERVQKLANEWRNMTGKARREAMSRGDEVVPIIYDGIAERASFDVRLVDAIENAGKEGTPEMEPHPDSKPARVVKNLLEIYNSHPSANQVVFMEQGMSTSVTRSEGEPGDKKQVRYKAFSTLNDMIERLVQAGVPREQIAAVTGSTSKDKRAEIAEKMNTGEIRIVFGSTDSLGVGVNMQRNMRAMHHMDAPWMPGELEQRNGRGQRQGNQWNTVKEYRYLTDRLDGRRWQVLAIKQRFITDFMKSKGEERVIEGDAASDEQGDILSTFADAAGDPRILVREKLKKRVEALKGRERLHSHAQADARRQVRRLNQQIQTATESLNKLRDTGAVKAVTRLIESQQGDGFRATIFGQSFTSSVDARNFVRDNLASEMRLGQDREIGAYGNQKLRAVWGQHESEPSLYIDIAEQHIESRGASLPSLAAQLRDFRDNAEAEYERRITEQTATLGRMEQVSSEPFHLADQLETTERQLENLERDIAKNPVAPPHWLRSGAPTETIVNWKGKEFEVTGHRWNDSGWYVLAEDESGTVAIPYLEVTDEQGMSLYEEREFQPPRVVEAEQIPEAEQGSGDAAFSVGVAPEEQLSNQVPIVVRSEAADRDMGVRQLRDKVFGELRTEGGFYNDAIGNITVSRKGWGKSRANANDRAKLLTVPQLGNIIRNGVFVGTRPAEGKSGIEAYHHIAHRVTVDGVPLVAMVTVEQATDGTVAYYNHTVLDDVFSTGGTREQVDSLLAAYRRPLYSVDGDISRERNLPVKHQRVVNSVTSGLLGPVVQELISRGHVTLHPNTRTLPTSVDRDPVIQGMTDRATGKIHLVTENLTPQTAMPVLLHEVFHARGESITGAPRWANLMRQMERYYEAAQKRQAEGRVKDGDFWDGALRRVQDAQERGFIDPGREFEEFAAYAIENYELAPSGIKKWIDNIIGMVKDWLARTFDLQVGSITPAQLRAMTVAAIRDMSGQQPVSNASVGGSAFGSSAFSASGGEVTPRVTGFKTKGGKPLVEVYYPREGVNVLVRRDHWDSGAETMPAFNSLGNRNVGLGEVSRADLRNVQNLNDDPLAQVDEMPDMEEPDIPEHAYTEPPSDRQPPRLKPRTGEVSSNEAPAVDADQEAAIAAQQEVEAGQQPDETVSAQPQQAEPQREYTEAEKAEALDDALESLLEAERPIDRATAESPVRGDFIGQAADDLTGARALYSRFLAHPYQIASMYSDFTPVFETATKQAQTRNQIIEDLHREHVLYQRLPAESKATVNKILELGRLEGQTWSVEDVMGGVENRGFVYGVEYDAEGNPKRVRKPYNAQLSKAGEEIQLTRPEAEAYVALRKMFDRALDKFRDQLLDEMGFGWVPTMDGDRRPLVIRELDADRILLKGTVYSPEERVKLREADGDPEKVAKILENHPILTVMKKVGMGRWSDEHSGYVFNKRLKPKLEAELGNFLGKSVEEQILSLKFPGMSSGRSEMLENIAKMFGDIEQAKRTGYVPLARYGDYVVAVKEREHDIKYVNGDNGEIFAVNVPEHLGSLLDSIGGYYNQTQQAWELTPEQQSELERANEVTVYSEKVETGLRDMFGRNSVRNVKKRRGAVADIPTVKEAIDRINAEQVGDNSNRRIVTFETSKKRNDGEIDLSSLDALAEVAQLDTATWEAVRAELTKAMQSGGFRKHFFQSNNVPGYSADFERSMADYIVGISGYLSRRQHVSQWDRAISRIKGENLHRYAQKYRDYVNQPAEEMAMLRQTGFFLYIAGNISSGILNATQVALMTMPLMSMISSNSRATREVAQAYRDAIKMTRVNREVGFDMFDFSNAPEDVRESLQKASDEGLLLPLQSLEIMGIAGRRSVKGRAAQRRYDTLVQSLAVPFTYTERLNRVVTFMAAHRLASKPGFESNIRRVFRNNPQAQSMFGGDRFSPYSFAEFAVDETQFRMGKGNRPTAMRGVGTAIFQFKSFMLQFFEAMYRNATLHGKEGKIGTAATLGMLIALSGLWGAPGADDLRELFEGMYRGITKRDIDTRTALRKWIYETTNQQWLASLVDGGFPYAAGADMSRRVGMGQIMPDVQNATGIPWIDTLISAGGIPADMLVGRPLRSAQALGSGNVGSAVTSLLPNFVENTRKSVQWANDGVRTRSGRMVLPKEEVNTSSIIMKSIGVQPSQISDVYAYGAAQRRSQSSADALKREFLSDYVRALGALAKNTDPSKNAKLQAEVSEIISNIYEANEKLPPHQQIDISRSAVNRQMQIELGGAPAGFGRERRAARGEAATLREVFGVQ